MALLSSGVRVAGDPSVSSNLVSIADLQHAVIAHDRVIRSFHLEGVVCAADWKQKLIVLQDASATALLECPFQNEMVEVGEHIAINGKHAVLLRNRFGIQIGSPLVVDNDGTHHELMKSGSTILKAGFQPVRLNWFNGQSNLIKLNLEYDGPGIPRQNVPASALWHDSGGTLPATKPQPGVQFAAYVGKDWYALPQFCELHPVAQGVVTNFDLACRARDTDTALAFNGYLKITRPGLYTFYLDSSSGSQLYVGTVTNSGKLTALGSNSVPVIKGFSPALLQAGGDQWMELEGAVTFVGETCSGLAMELTAGKDRIPVTVIDSSGLSPTSLLDKRIRATGICEVSYDLEQKKTVSLIVLNAGQIHDASEASASSAIVTNALLTAAAQVQRLKPELAREQLLVKLKGVVTQSSPTSLVLQDPSGGVFIHYSAADWTAQPRVGELWEIEGTTDPGDFSPVIYATNAEFLGNGVLPEPIQPTWDQLMSGSLDAQYVEIQGVVIDVADDGMTLLTPNGKFKVAVEEMSNSYRDGRELFIETHAAVGLGAMRTNYLDSVVRIRGCLVAVWNQATRQVVAGQIRLVAAVISVEQSEPREPFALPVTRAADLLLFHPRSRAFQRIKMTGQVIYSRPDEYDLLDESNGFHIVSEKDLSLRTGDLVEAVGFPQLGGPAPVLEAIALRKTGHHTLPVPVRLMTDALVDRGHDSTLVQTTATLISEKTLWGEQVLEMQAGPVHFVARLRPGAQSSPVLPDGSRLQLTGVYDSNSGNRDGTGVDAFELLLNNAADIVVLQQPSWWTVRHAVTVAIILGGALGVAFVWITMLRQKVELRTAQLQKEIEARQVVEQHRLMEQERIRVARDLHDELGVGLTQVGLLGSLAKDASTPEEKKYGYIEQITESARALVTSLDEIVWAVNPQYDSVSSLVNYYELFAQRFLNLAGIACRFETPADLSEHPLDSRLRHGVFLAFKETLNNIVRHSGATEVRLKIDVACGQLAVSIADNGRGFAANGKEPGSDGLAGMKERMRQLGGQCRIESQSGRGTTVSLAIPL